MVGFCEHTKPYNSTTVNFLTSWKPCGPNMELMNSLVGKLNCTYNIYFVHWNVHKIQSCMNEINYSQPSLKNSNEEQ